MKKRKNRRLIIIVLTVVFLGLLAFETLIGIPKAPFNNPSVQLSGRSDDYGRFYDIAVEYAAAIDREYFNNLTNTSIDYPSPPLGLMRGRPTLWPYHTVPMMANRVLMSMDGNDPNRAYFERLHRNAMSGLKRYRTSRTHRSTSFRYGQKNVDYETIMSSYTGGRKGLMTMIMPKDVYFDDDIWLAKEYIIAYNLTGDEDYLKEAVGITNFVLEYGYARNDAEGVHGIFWNYGKMMNKEGSIHSCSTAPFIITLIELAEILEDTHSALAQNYADVAVRLYDFMRAKLRNPANGVYWDHINVIWNDDGSVSVGETRPGNERWEFTYNTGCMLSAGAVLYRYMSTRNSDAALRYLTEAKQTMIDADARFIRTEGDTYSMDRHAWFNSLLLEGYIYLHNEGVTEVSVYIAKFANMLGYAHDNHKTDKGLISPSWFRGWDAWTDEQKADRGERPDRILLQGANAACYAMLAAYYM